jgi:hypothetical protein
LSSTTPEQPGMSATVRWQIQYCISNYSHEVMCQLPCILVACDLLVRSLSSKLHVNVARRQPEVENCNSLIGFSFNALELSSTCALWAPLESTMCVTKHRHIQFSLLFNFLTFLIIASLWHCNNYWLYPAIWRSIDCHKHICWKWKKHLSLPSSHYVGWNESFVLQKSTSHQQHC